MPNEPSVAFVRRVLTVVAIVGVVLLVAILAWQGVRVLMTVFAGVLIGVLLRGMSVWVSGRTSLAYGASLAVVCVGVTVVAAGAVSLSAASITQEMSEMLDQLPGAVEQVRQRIEANPLGRRLLAPLEGEGGGKTSLSTSRVLGMASGILGGLGTTFLIFVLGIFLAADPDTYRRGAILLVAPEHRARVGEVFDEVGGTLQRWLVGRLLLMAVIGVLSWIGLLLLGVPLALSLGLIAGLLSFIPNIGPIISVIPAMLIAATVTPMLAVWVAMLYLAIQAAETYLLEAYVVRKSVALPPVTNIAFQLLMGTWLSVMGLVIATPLLAALKVAVTRFYVEDVLGDPQPDASSS